MQKVEKNTPLEKTILTFFHRCWDTLRDGELPPFFPGPQPISIERRHFHLLRKHPYVVCEKSDGVRYALVTTVFESRKVTCLVNRALDVFTLKLNTPKSANLGTVLDGELVDTQFIVYDAIYVSGVDIKKLPLDQRLHHANYFISGIMHSKTDVLRVKLKQFYPFSQFRRFVQEVLPSLTYKTDGFIFTPVNLPIRIGTHEDMFKWKERDKNTIDFQAKWCEVQNRWNLFIQEKGVLYYETDTVTDVPLAENCIVECQYMCDDEPMWWKPIHVRTDKKHPNNKRTFYKTLKNISENIQLHEFFM